MKLEHNKPHLNLDNGSRVAVMGGGPAGSLFSYFLLDMADRVGLDLQVDIYEPRDFSLVGPPGCNMCAGIISESLIQLLALEGIQLPPSVVQRGMDTYILHTHTGTVLLETPQLEKRIGTVFRGAGPLGMAASEWTSFDGFLLDQALQRGARLIRRRIDNVERVNGHIQVRTRQETSDLYDLLAVAAGVNSRALRLFPPVLPEFEPPRMMQTFIREYHVGREKIEQYLGEHSIHFFLLDIPGLDFAAIIPKGDYVTVCILGEGLDSDDFDAFLNTLEVKDCMPPDWQVGQFDCHCAPRINVSGAVHPYADRMVFLGDSGISRLYKDGIGAAYRAAKYAASTAIFEGIAAEDFEGHYWRSSRIMEQDNSIGKIIFTIVRQIKPRQFATRALVRMIEHEQPKRAKQRRMSKIMWDTFTGSAPYREIFLSCFHPAFWSRFLWYLGTSIGG